MKKNNIIYLVMALLAFSIIFSGCSPNVLENEDDVKIESDVVIKNDASQDVTVDAVDETVDEELISDDDVEIGELI